MLACGYESLMTTDETLGQHSGGKLPPLSHHRKMTWGRHWRGLKEPGEQEGGKEQIPKPLMGTYHGGFVI